MLSVTISNLDSFVSYTVSFLVMQILKIIIDSCSKYSSKKNQYYFTIRNITVWQTHSEEPICHLLHKSLGSAFDLLFLISSDDCLICFDQNVKAILHTICMKDVHCAQSFCAPYFQHEFHDSLCSPQICGGSSLMPKEIGNASRQRVD